MYDYRSGSYQRVDKRTARRLYNEGQNIYVTTLYCRPEVCSPVDVQQDYEGCQGYTFDQIINEFIWYNCNYATGRYPAYYIKEGK